MFTYLITYLGSGHSGYRCKTVICIVTVIFFGESLSPCAVPGIVRIGPFSSHPSYKATKLGFSFYTFTA